MVRTHGTTPVSSCDSPRIRGDGPYLLQNRKNLFSFSPYSRGWSPSGSRSILPLSILPVFAGMVPCTRAISDHPHNSPRIRGDGPKKEIGDAWKAIFSPYSRGWSRFNVRSETGLGIFPVFAGMVPTIATRAATSRDFPRIRGDGPIPVNICFIFQRFSPYSRGWSQKEKHSEILERHFPRIRGDGPDELARNLVNFTFSPYSRGWSQGGQAADTCIIIFPVFAGMVPVAKREWVHPLHFPRIRGDNLSGNTTEECIDGDIAAL